jgi:hypothetical protein
LWDTTNFNHKNYDGWNFGKIIGDRYKLWASNVLNKFMTYMLIIICIILIWFSNSNMTLFINWLKTTFGCTYVEATYILSNNSTIWDVVDEHTILKHLKRYFKTMYSSSSWDNMIWYCYHFKHCYHYFKWAFNLLKGNII